MTAIPQNKMPIGFRISVPPFWGLSSGAFQSQHIIQNAAPITYLETCA
jgi:hypothetical protein